MPEYYKRVVVVQFAPTEEEKAKVLKGETVLFENERIRHGANGRFHVLLKAGDRLIPVYDKQWIAREPDLHIYYEHEFRSAFLQKGEVDSARN